jgi:type I restriction enzyme S subunit
MVSIKHGFAFKGVHFSDSPTPDILVTPGNFAVGGGFKTDKLKFYDGPVPEEYELKKDDLVVTMTDLSKQADTLGYSALIPEHPSLRFLHNQRVGLVALKSNQLDKLYLYFLLRSQAYRHHVVSSATGSTVKHTSPSKIVSFEFRLPPIETQKEIGSILKQLEDKALLNHQINQTLEQMAQAIFKSWFVDFEPVKAKIAVLEAGGSEEDALLAAMQVIAGDTQECANVAKGSAPGVATGGKLARLQAEQPEQYADLRATAELFPSAMQDSELGEIPEGWGVKKIGDLVQRLKVGKRYSQKSVSDSGAVPVLDQGKSGIIGYHNDAPGISASSEDPVIVFANHTCYMRMIMHDFSTIQNVLPFKGKSLSIFWLYYATIGKQGFIEYKGHWPDFIIKEIAVPCASLARRFEGIVSNLVKAKFRNEQQNDTLSGIRNVLLPKLLSGELSVSEAEPERAGSEETAIV